MSDRDKIRKAFRELTKRGWFCRMNFMCCGSCGSAAVPKKNAKKAVFFHQQDNEHLKGGNIDNYGLYMNHSGGDAAYAIVAILNEQGMDASWNGDDNTRILVKHKLSTE